MAACTDCGGPAQCWFPRQKVYRCRPCRDAWWDAQPVEVCAACGGDGPASCPACAGDGVTPKPGYRMVAIAVSDGEADALADFTYRVGPLEPLNPLIARITHTTETTR